MFHNFAVQKQFLDLINTIRTVQDARKLHSHFRDGLKYADTFAMNKVIEMYGRCGSASEAYRIFEMTPRKDSFTWEMMLLAFAENRNLERAMDLFDVMPIKTIVACNIILKALTSDNRLHEALELFQKMPQWKTITWNILITAIAKTGNLSQAQAMFDAIPFKNIVSCNAMLGAYSRVGEVENAKAIFDSMELWNLISWNSMLAAYSVAGNPDKAKRFYTVEMPVWDLATWNCLVKHSSTLEESLKTFSAMLEHDLTSYTTIISALISNGFLSEARSIFLAMPEWNSFVVSAAMPVLELDEAKRMVASVRDPICWSSFLSLLIDENFVDEARRLIGFIPEMDVGCWNTVLASYALKDHESFDQAKAIFESMMPKWDLISWNTMLSLYSQLGSIASSRQFFDRMPKRDMVSWNTMLSAYAQAGLVNDAKNFFERKMPRHSPVSWSLLLSVCHDVEKTFELMPRPSLPAWNALLAALATRGHLEKVRSTFDSMPEHNLQSWNTVLTDASAFGNVDYVLSCFHMIPKPNVSSWNRLLAAYAAERDILHAIETFNKMPFRDVISWNTLLNAYAETRNVSKTFCVFPSAPEENVDTWNILLAALAVKGDFLQAVETFREMTFRQSPNDVSFIVLMTASGHLGTVFQTRNWLIAMESDFGIRPGHRHYCCMLDSLARSGHIYAAQDLLANMPFVPSALESRCLIAASANAKQGKQLVQHLFSADPSAAANYVMFSKLWRTLEVRIDVNSFFSFPQDSKAKN